MAVRAADTDAAPAVGEAVAPESAKLEAKSTAKAKAKPASVAKYRDAAGNSWGGRGPKPGWMKAALAAGKKLEELAV